MPGRNKDATIEARQEGGEQLKEHYIDHFWALIEAKPVHSEVKKSDAQQGAKEDKKK